MENQTPSAELQARIDSERQRLLAEQNIERDLTGQRLAPLEAGDDEALDAVEASINACRDRQLRIQERLEILAVRLDEAKQREETARLDGIRESAEKARERGIALIRNDYARQAKALAKTLARLAAIDDFIDSCNRTLSWHGQGGVDSPNRIRNRATQRIPVTVRRRVGMGQEPHPAYNQVLANPNMSSEATIVALRDGRTFPVWMEMDVQEIQVIEGVSQKELWRTVELPSASDDYEAYWSEDLSHSFEAMSELKAYGDVPAPARTDDDDRGGQDADEAERDTGEGDEQ